jgi:hypothetical protein
MTTEDTIAAIRRAEVAAQQRHVQAETGQAQAEARVTALLEDLQREFGVTSLEEAKALLAALETETATEAGRVQELLVQAGGTL